MATATTTRPEFAELTPLKDMPACTDHCEPWCTEHQWDNVPDPDTGIEYASPDDVRGWCQASADVADYRVFATTGTPDGETRILLSKIPRADGEVTPDEADHLAHVIQRMVAAARAAARAE